FEVDLVAAVGLEAVDAEGDECGESSLELLRDRRLSQIEDELLERTEELGARIADPALRLRRDPEHEAQSESVHAVDQPSRIREPMTVELERADAGLPRVVDEDPSERNLRGAESRDVFE